MRRARISIKPNVRPGGRGVAPGAEDKSSQKSTSTSVDDTQQTPSPPQSQLDARESDSAVATGDGNVPGSPSEKASLNTNDGAPSSANTPATTALQRRSRLSATPNLARPKVRSAPPSSTGNTASLLSGPSKTSSPVQAAFPPQGVPVAISRDDSQNSSFSEATTEANCPPSSPCLPSTSGCPESPSSPPSQQEPHQTPKKIPNEDFGPQEGATPASCTHSPYVKLSRVDGPDSPLRNKMSSDKQRVLRALKLKELMKLEKRKEITEKKSRRRKQEHCIELDRDKMSLADFIYYLPESNPMTSSSLAFEETQAQTIAPSSPIVQKLIAEVDEDNDDADDDMLVPKVRVAEDGSLILDEESLTVRVQRTSDTIVENANPLFERGSSTTYASFRKKNYVKSWSVRETDMFYLAISMVGTDFSMIAQLLTHRTRAEIKRKFKKEERVSAWRVDNAFRNKRPFDSEFFSFLLKRILAKDKQKGKSIKLVVKSSKEKKGKGGKKAKPLEVEESIDDDDDELCSVDSVCFDLEKENKDGCNVNEADVPSSTSKKRKRTKVTKPKVLSCEKTCKPKKKNKTPKKGKCSVEVEGSSVNADNEDQSYVPVSKKKRKQSKKVDQEQQEDKRDAKEKCKKKNNKKKLKVRDEEPTDGESYAVNEEHNELSPVPTKKRKRSKGCAKEEEATKGKQKTKKSKTSKEVRNEEPTDGESCALNEEHNEVSPVPTKKRKRSKECAKEEEATNEKRKTKKSKMSKKECTGSELGADGSEVLTAAPDAEEDQGEKLSLESTTQEKISQSSSKRSKRPLPNLAKRKAKKFSEPKATVEIKDTVEEPQDESCKEAENEFNIICLAEEQLQKQPVVVLERTPPRLKDAHSSSESQDQPQSSQSPLRSPGQQARAEKVKRNLTVSDDGSEVPTVGLCAEGNQGEKLSLEISLSSSKCSPGRQTRAEKVKRNQTASEGERMDQCQTGSNTSPVDMSSTAMPYEVVIQDSKDMEECRNLHHLELLTSSEENGQTLLKSPVVLVSHEEVECYLGMRAQTAAEESTASRGDGVGEHTDGLEEQGSSIVTLEDSISQDPEMKEADTASISSQQNLSEKRRFIKPTPCLSRAAQTFHRPRNLQTTEFRENTASLNSDSTQLQCSSPVEVQVKIALNECLSEEEGTCSVTPEENDPWDVSDDARTTADDLPSLTSAATSPRPSKTEDQEVSSFLEKLQVPDTTPSDKDVNERRTKLEKSGSQISENKVEITDQDSEPSESAATDTMIEEPQTEMKRIVPVSCSSDDSSVCTQDSTAPEKHIQFAKHTSNLELASQVMINPQQTSEPNEDPAEKPEHQSPVKLQHCYLDHDIKSVSREDKLVVSEVDLQECKQDEDLMSPVLLLASTQISAPNVSVDSTGKGNEEQNDPVLSDASSAPFEAHSPVSSFYDPSSEHTSSMYDMDTMLFSESAAENIQIPDEQDSEKQDGTEERSEAHEDCIVTLDGNAKSEISVSAGVETGDTDNQSEEPTFILTLYEIPTSQLFHEADCGQQDIPPYELQPAQVQTSSLITGSSQSLSCTLEVSSASLHMESEETNKPCKSVSHKVLDDSLVPLSKDAAEDASTQLISSQENSCDDANFLISPPEMLSCNSAMLTDVPKLDEIPTQTKAATQRRSKIKVKPKLKPYVVGPSNNGQFDCAPSQTLITSHAIAQAEIESNQKTSAQETVSPKIHLSHEDREWGANPGHDSVISTAIVPGSEDMRDESQVKWESPLRTGLQMDEDSVVDPPVHRVLTDAFVASSEEMENVFNEKEIPHDSELQKPEDLSVCLPESARSLSQVNVQKEKMADISKKTDSCREASSETPSVSQEKIVPLQRRGRMHVKPKIPIITASTKDDFSRQEQTDIGSNKPATTQIILPSSLIKGECVEVELSTRSERENFSDIQKESSDTENIEEVTKTKQQTPFTTVETSACTESSPVELKIKGGHKDVLSETLVPVSMESGSPVQSSLQMGEESQQVLAAEEDQETHSHESISHMLLTDIFIPVCEDMQDDQSKEWMTTGKISPHEADRSQMREDPDTADLLCAVSQSSNVGPSISPKSKRHTQGKGKLLVKMTFPKRTAGDSPKSGEQSQTMPPSSLMPKQEVDATLNSPETECISEPKVESTQCSFETFTCSDLLPEDHEAACGGFSHMLPSDILVPVLDESAEHNLHKEAVSVGLQEDSLKVEKSTDIERPANTETDETTASQSVSVEWKTPSCRRSTLRPKPKLSKKRDDPLETNLCQPGSTQSSSATPQQSLDPQAEEWSLKSNMLPMDSDEIENWCEGVSHMLLSDAFVPVSEEIGENSTDLKVFVSSSPHEDEEHALSLPKSEETPSEISDEVCQLDTISDLPKIEESNESLPASQAKKSPARSTFQMTLRSPERRLNVLKTAQAAPTTPQRAQTSKVKESMRTPTKQHTGEISGVCRVQLEKLSVEEICTPQSLMQPKHHSTPVTVKTILRGNEIPKASLALHGSRSPGLELHADVEAPVPPGYSPKIVLHRVPITDANAPTSSPARVSTTASRPPADQQFSQNSPPISNLDADKDPVQVSQFFLDDIFTEVVDPD